MAADYVAESSRARTSRSTSNRLRALLPPVAAGSTPAAARAAPIWLAEQGADVVGLDASPEMLARARAR